MVALLRNRASGKHRRQFCTAYVLLPIEERSLISPSGQGQSLWFRSKLVASVITFIKEHEDRLGYPKRFTITIIVPPELVNGKLMMFLGQKRNLILTRQFDTPHSS